MTTTPTASIEIGDARHVAPGAPGAALPRRKIVFAVVAFALMMASVDQTIVATALHTIQHELDGSVALAGWTITVYGLGQVTVMPLAGWLSDRYGRKRVFLVAIAIFTLASLSCGLATNMYVLIALRAVQSIGGGAIMPSATGIVADHFGPNRDRATGLFTSIFPLGGAVGPLIGGAFVDGGAWRGIFLVNVPVGIAVIVLAAVLLPRGTPSRGRRADIPGILLMVGGLLALMLGITALGDPAIGADDWRFFVPVVVGAALIALFLRRMATAAEPFIPIRLIAGRGFGVMNLTNLLLGAAVIGFGALVPLYAQDRFHIAPLPSGTLLTARSIGMIAIAAVATFLLRRIGYRIPMMVGFGLSALGLLGAALVPTDVTPYLWLSLTGALTGLGQGMALPASNNAIMQLAGDRVSAVAGLRGMFRQVGAIFAISVTTAAIARSDDIGTAFAIAFLVFAGILLALVPLTLLVPEHRGRW
jgi:EmrB/QacA subfamily drug resistance transporter